jgi:subtilase family serine protease
MNGDSGHPCSTRTGPHPCLETAAAQPPAGGDAAWARDTALAVEWFHAVAPGADILLVQARQAAYPDLLAAVDLAVDRGARIVVMSWSSAEFAGETDLDVHFRRPGVTFVAATGDQAGEVVYPAASPWVLAVGGTTLLLAPTGQVMLEVPWTSAGWGVSAYERALVDLPRNPCVNAEAKRRVPDVAYSADPEYGYAVYSSSPEIKTPEWFRYGGTSAGAPQWGALLAVAASSRPGGLNGAADVRSHLYARGSQLAGSTAFRSLATSSSDGCETFARVGLGTPLARPLTGLLARGP